MRYRLTATLVALLAGLGLTGCTEQMSGECRTGLTEQNLGGLPAGTQILYSADECPVSPSQAFRDVIVTRPGTSGAVLHAEILAALAARGWTDVGSVDEGFVTMQAPPERHRTVSATAVSAANAHATRVVAIEPPLLARLTEDSVLVTIESARTP